MLISSNQKLQDAFAWAKAKALSYVQTGQSGLVDKSERGEGHGHAAYIPSYWAGYTSRTAFYSRDFCHQASGAHLLGLELENYTMLGAFAATATAPRKWFPLWALNFDGSPYSLDYRGDGDFVREVPAVFELVEQCYRQYLWSANRQYLDDPAIATFCEKAVSDFIRLHDTRVPNGVAEGDGSGDIFRGAATYNEIRSPMVEAGDGIACQYQALLAYSKLLAFKGADAEARAFARKAAALKAYFNAEWGVKKKTAEYVRGYTLRGRALTDFGLENSWYMPMKLITQPGEKNDGYLDFIARAVDDPKQRPSNLEAITYLPGTFFPYGRDEVAWKWMEYIIDQPDREYPEISFVLVANAVEGLAGFEPNAPEQAFVTRSHLPDAISDLTVSAIPMGGHRLAISHTGTSRSAATHLSGDGPLVWEAQFCGKHRAIQVDGRAHTAKSKKVNGVRVSFVTLALTPGQTITAEVNQP